MTVVLVVIAFALFPLGIWTGAGFADSRHAAFMAAGWAYLAEVAKRREIGVVDIAKAFGAPEAPTVA